MDTNNNSNISSSHDNGKKILVVIFLVAVIVAAYILWVNSSPQAPTSPVGENSQTGSLTTQQILQELSKNQAPAPTFAEQQKVISSLPKSTTPTAAQKQAVLDALSKQ